MPSGSSGRGFPKEDRLLERRDFLRARGRGRKAQTQHLIAIALPSRVGRRRIGLTVSTRVGDSVRRNRVKRWLREIYRHERDALPEGIDLVIIAKTGAAEADFGSIRGQFLEIAARLTAPRQDRRSR
jgi:ribonuclease P protein component